MRISFCGKLLLVGACLIAGATAQGQQQNNLKTGIDVAVVYHPLLTHQVGNGDFWMQGGSVQLHTQLWRGWGVVADVSGVHETNMNGSGVGLDLVTATFGPRYNWAPAHRRYELFGQVLAGSANGINSVFPTPNGAINSTSSLALKIGGGMNIALSRRIALRAFEANWLRTQLPNATTNVQNNLDLGAGVVYRFW